MLVGWLYAYQFLVGWVLCLSVFGEMVLGLPVVGVMVLGLSISWWREVYQFVVGHFYAYLFGVIVAVGLSVDDGNVLENFQLFVG